TSSSTCLSITKTLSGARIQTRTSSCSPATPLLSLRLTTAMKLAIHGIVQKPFFVVGAILIAIGVVPVILTMHCHAQSELPDTSSEAVEVPAETSQETPAPPPEEFPVPFYPNPEDIDSTPDTDLETGLPLKALLSPFRWGSLSLLSFSAYEGYSTNPDF